MTTRTSAPGRTSVRGMRKNSSAASWTVRWILRRRTAATNLSTRARSVTVADGTIAAKPAQETTTIIGNSTILHLRPWTCTSWAVQLINSPPIPPRSMVTQQWRDGLGIIDATPGTKDDWLPAFCHALPCSSTSLIRAFGIFA